MPTKTVLDILESQNVITAEEAKSIRQESRESGKSIYDILSQRKVEEAVVVEAKSTLLGIPVWSMEGVKVQYEVLQYIPEESARHYQAVPLAVKEGVLEVGMVSPEDLEAREALQFISSGVNMPFKIFLISPSDFNAVMEEYKGLGGTVTKALGEYQSSLEEGIDLPSMEKLKEQMVLSEEAPVSKMVAVMLRHAIEGRASDVHVEPGKGQLRVRFRVDGVLYTSLFLPMNVHEAIISRVKIMANLKIDEKRAPQDGRFKIETAEDKVSFRVSVLPVYNGEKYLREAVESVLKQSFSDFEFIIIDDGSMDKTEEIIKSYNDIHKKIKLYVNDFFKNSNGILGDQKNLCISKKTAIITNHAVHNDNLV